MAEATDLALATRDTRGRPDDNGALILTRIPHRFMFVLKGSKRQLVKPYTNVPRASLGLPVAYSERQTM